MPIPAFDHHGLLPAGVYECTLAEIDSRFGWNPHRLNLLSQFKSFLVAELRPVFPDPLFFDGSFVTDKHQPDDIDVVLDLTNAPNARQWQGLQFMAAHQSRIFAGYRVHFWI